MKHRLRSTYLVRLRRSLQDEGADALLVAVLVHDDKGMRKPRRCKEFFFFFKY